MREAPQQNFGSLMNQIQVERTRVNAYRDQLAVAIAERDEARSICCLFAKNYDGCPDSIKKSIIEKYPWLKAGEKA